MGLINFIQLSCLFDSTGLDTFTFSNDAIEVVPHGGESDRLKVFYQRAFLSLPCTERQLYDWAQDLDRHECFHVEPEKRHHFVDRLSKDFKEKWQLDNERRKDWYFQLGFKPDNVESADNLAHWLTLAKWTKEQAAHLICGSNPRQAHHYDALDMLLERMPSIDTQAPIEWLKWANDQGLLDCSPSRIREWYAENRDNPVVSDGAASQVDIDTKPRKKLMPQVRDTNEGLSLIYEITANYKVEYLDELPALQAWGKIISGDFKSDFIKNISDAKKSITLNGGDKLDKMDFSCKYRRRFKATK